MARAETGRVLKELLWKREISYNYLCSEESKRSINTRSMYFGCWKETQAHKTALGISELLNQTDICEFQLDFAVMADYKKPVRERSAAIKLEPGMRRRGINGTNLESRLQHVVAYYLGSASCQKRRRLTNME